MKRHRLYQFAIAALLVLPLNAQAKNAETFTNPLLPSGADPWVTKWNGSYYFMSTTGRNLVLRKTADITDLKHAPKKVVWTPEPGKQWSQALWAPELHRWGNKWYIYFTASDGTGPSRRIYIVENSSADPIDGDWTFKGKVATTPDRWMIDGDLFETGGEHYLLWSGWETEKNGQQNIYIAHMSNPWTIDSQRTLLSQPKYDWELKNDNHPVTVNEGPEALIHGGSVFVVYSASGCWTDEYKLGVLQASAKANLLDPKIWKKYDHPFFQQDASAQAYGPGHNGFFRSQDGSEDWIIYHANPKPGQGCKGFRSPRIQRFTWNADGTPNFGKPVPLDSPQTKPKY